MTKPKAIWSPQPGPQAEAISARWCDELFYGGARGGGKSDYLLGDYLQDVQHFGPYWQGILFRKSLTDLQNMILRSKQLYGRCGAVWKEQKAQWEFPNGAILRFAYLNRLDDWMNYQGHAYSWIGYDELPQWPNSEFYDKMKACRRPSSGDAPTALGGVMRVRATGNPGGPGHQWVKQRFIDPEPNGMKVIDDGVTGWSRLFIKSRVSDNKILLQIDPNYVNTLRGTGSPELVKAWLDGDWNIVTGAYFPEFGDKHVIRPFEIPAHWFRFRSMDWGSAAPFAVHWFAVSDGSREYPKGALIVYREWYGCVEGKHGVGLKLPTEEVARGIVERTPKWEKVSYTVVDPSMFKSDGGPSHAEIMGRYGVVCMRGDNSRVAGWGQLRSRLTGIEDSGYEPLIYFFPNCSHIIRTLPVLQHDGRKPEDCDTDGEDHAPDSVRYGVMSRSSVKFSSKEEKLELRGLHQITWNELMKANPIKNRKGPSWRI